MNQDPPSKKGCKLTKPEPLFIRDQLGMTLGMYAPEEEEDKSSNLNHTKKIIVKLEKLLS